MRDKMAMYMVLLAGSRNIYKPKALGPNNFLENWPISITEQEIRREGNRTREASKLMFLINL